MAQPDPHPTEPAGTMLDAWYREAPAALDRRGLRVEVASSALFVLAAAAALTLLPANRAWSVPGAVVLVLAYAAAARIRFHVGAGYAVPTQLLLVPLLFAAPAAAVPALVAAGLVLSGLPEQRSGAAARSRLLTAPGDAWHALGPAVVFALAGAGQPSFADWPLYAGALAAQCAIDVGVSCARERLGRGIPVREQLEVLLWVCLVDMLLAPVGFLAVLAADGTAWAAPLVAPLLVLVWLVARDRRSHVASASERLVALRRERERLEAALRRVGEAFSANLDADALLDVGLRTVVDALGAEAGRAMVRADPSRPLRERAQAGDPGAFQALLAAAERDVTVRGRSAEFRHGRARSLAHPLHRRGAEAPEITGVLSVARPGGAFSTHEQELFHYLAGEVAVAVDNALLHERLHRQALTDDLTGLSNHRRFQELLGREVDRSHSSGDPLGLVLLDIDDFKLINDTHGHQTGDLVLRALGLALRRTCRASDEPARYGGEEFGVVLPDADLGATHALAERLRVEIARIEVITPDGGLLQVRASFGAASLPGGVADKSALVSAADAALYEAKRAGKNRVAAGDVMAALGPAARPT